MEIIVPARKIPVMAECDLLVCGAGPAGVCAAVSAARKGLRVVLLERWSFAGGMGTAGMVNIWHTSDREKQVIFGIVNEIMERGLKQGWCAKLKHYPQRHETHLYDVEGLKRVYDDLLVDCGVNVFYTLPAADLLKEGDRITAVFCDTKTGRKAILPKFVIDATGDGDIAAQAGVPFELGRQSDGLVQGMTLIYKLAGIDAEEVQKLSGKETENIFREMTLLRDKGLLPPFGPISFGYYAEGGLPNMNPYSGNPLDEASLTKGLIQTRRQMFAYLEYWKKHVRGFERAKIESSAPALGVRESRRFLCRERLTAEDVISRRKRPDAVGHGFWMIDIHDPKGTGHTTWEEQKFQPAGTSYHLPFGMMVPENISNLLIACRAANSSHEAHASVRLMSHVAVLGQAAGTATALAMEEKCRSDEIDIKHLQSMLQKDGVYLKDIP